MSGPSIRQSKFSGKMICSRFCLLTLAVALCAATVPALAGSSDARPKADRNLQEKYVPDEVLVLVSADTNLNGRLDANEGFDSVGKAISGKVLAQSRRLGTRQVLKVKLPAGKTIKGAMAENWAKADARIVAVEPNYIVHALAMPNDPLFPSLWGLHNTGQTGGVADADIDAPEAWNITTGSSSVVVAVIDTGLDYTHPDLAGNVWTNPGEIPGDGIDNDGNGFIDDVHGWDFFQNDNDPSDAAGHGTHVSGTIAGMGNNALGVAGVNWSAKIMACRFLNAGGSGNTFDAIGCIDYAVANGAKVLSNSWGGGGYSASLEAAIANARDHGVLFVAAAGNSGTNNDVTPHYPSSYNVSNVISVAATTHTDALASFSCYGLSSVHLGAPGQNVLSTVPTQMTLFAENFEGATVPGFAGTQMSVGGPVNLWGTLTDAVTAGNHAARGDIANTMPYLGGSDGWIMTPTMDLRGRRALAVYFDIRIDCGTNDTLTCDVWNGSTWNNILTFSLSGLFPPDFYYYVLMDVPENLRSATNQFRWKWTTDAADNNYAGVEIDNIAVTCIGTDYSNAYDSYSGTSMATPHVSGVAALLLANNPLASISEVKARIVSSGDAIPALAGKTISGRRLNAYKALTAQPGLTVNSPNGGETWAIGGQAYISWGSIQGGATVDIDLLNGGSVYASIASGVANTGSFTWPIPANTPEGSDYQIRISDGTMTDQSDAYFSIVRFNDTCETATCVIDGIAATGSTAPATGTDITSCAYSDALDVWFRYTPSVSTTVVIDTEGSGFDTTLAVFDGCGGTELACDDDGGSGLLSRIQLNMVAGTQYMIRLAGYGGSIGNYVLHVTGGNGACGPQPPAAQSSSVVISPDTPANITLQATDDGLPNPPGALSYIIMSLPAQGGLSDPNGGAITTVNYTLLSGGRVATYAPNAGYLGPDSFTFKANDGGAPPEGGDSNIATVTINVISTIYLASMDTDPGWTLDPDWAWGNPTGGGSSCRDPSSGHTGVNVVGYNLAGDYPDNLTVRYAKTPAINCSQYEHVKLKFYRWLGIESSSFDHATVEVSNNGTAWTAVYNHTASSFCDGAWIPMEYDISAVADRKSTVYIRWSMGPTDGSVTFPGWNIDDVNLCGTRQLPGDFDGDNDVDQEDFGHLQACLTGPDNPLSDPACEDADLDTDMDVDMADAELFHGCMSGANIPADPNCANRP